MSQGTNENENELNKEHAFVMKCLLLSVDDDYYKENLIKWNTA